LFLPLRLNDHFPLAMVSGLFVTGDVDANGAAIAYL
jgi:hypothetical protein